MEILSRRLAGSLRRIVILLTLVPAIAPAQQATEPAVKAALLYKFASYVEWPADAFASPQSPFVIAVTGADEVAGELESLVRARSFDNRTITVRRLKEGDALAGCHALFVGARESGRVAQLARVARPLSILVVSDSERGLENGGVINFVSVEDRVGFEISIEAAERSNLRISSRMLAVARRVVSRSS
jgi:hypothetical protein